MMTFVDPLPKISKAIYDHQPINIIISINIISYVSISMIPEKHSFAKYQLHVVYSYKQTRNQQKTLLSATWPRECCIKVINFHHSH